MLISLKASSLQISHPQQELLIYPYSKKCCLCPWNFYIPNIPKTLKQKSPHHLLSEFVLHSHIVSKMLADSILGGKKKTQKLLF